MTNFKDFKKKISYKFDNTLTKGIGSMIWWLALSAIIIVIIITTIVWALQLSSTNSFFDQFWYFMLKTIGDDTTVKTTWFYRFFYLLIVFTSIFLTSILISILTQMIQNRIEELRKGRSEILERNHTIILGWSSKIYTILMELNVSATSEKLKNKDKKVIVILGTKDKVFMEDEIKRNAKHIDDLNVICRTGNPAEKSFLENLNIEEAKSIIILAEKRENPDTEVIKTLLALKGLIIKHKNSDDKDEYNKIFTKTVAELQNVENEKIIEIITNKETKPLKTKDFTARIIAQTSRQSGLPAIYEELLNYEDTEIYFIPNKLGEIEYQKAVLEYQNISIIGYFDKSDKANKNDIRKNYHLNPTGSSKIGVNDELIIIAESKKATIKPDITEKNIKNIANGKVGEKDKTDKNILILGWNDIAKQIVEELGSYKKDGEKQKITIISNEEITKIKDIKFKKAEKIELEVEKADYFNHTYLGNKKFNITKFNSIIILSDAELGRQESDVKNLTILHFIRDIEKKHIKENQSNNETTDIVCQLLDERNQELISKTEKNDFVVSAKLGSLFLTQMSEETRLFHVFDEIFDENGSEIYLKDISNYINIDENKEVTYAEIVKAVITKNSLNGKRQTVIGYEYSKRKDGNSKNEENIIEKKMVLNISKNKKITIEKDDRIIMLEETTQKEENKL